MAATFPTHWPENFETEELDYCANAAVVNTSDLEEPQLHTHRTGQIALNVSGEVAIQLKECTLAIPVRCAAWIPAQVPHCGRLSSGAQSVFLMVKMTPEFTAKLPKEPCRLILNRMTYEMLLYLAAHRPEDIGQEHFNALGRVIVDQIALSKLLPKHLAQIPDHPVLQRIAQNRLRYNNSVSNADLAREVNMTERTLSRLVLRETGMTLKRWRLQFCLLDSIPHLLTKMPLDEVAQQCGYATTAAYITAFHRVLGMTPGRVSRGGLAPLDAFDSLEGAE